MFSSVSCVCVQVCVNERERANTIFEASFPLWSCTHSGVVSGFSLTTGISAQSKTNKQACTGMTHLTGLITQT